MRTKAVISLILGCVFTTFSCSAQQRGGSATTKNSEVDNMLIYQLPNGGWSKHYTDGSAVDYTKPITAEVKSKIATDVKYATVDNSATTKEIQALAKAYVQTKDARYKVAVEKGISYLLSAQYEHGGFPQYYPNMSSYRGQVTYNDNAMINVLTVLNAVAKSEEGFEFVDESFRGKAQLAVQKGVDCILRTQVVQADSLSIWAAQYDEKTLQPAQARKFEPASLSTGESAGIVRFLMKQPITPAIEKSVHAAIKWFENHDIEGYRFTRTEDPKTGKWVRDLVADSTAVTWARFYDITNNRPLFGDRDQSVTYNFADVSEERKNGYAWFGEWPKSLIETSYQSWLKKVEKVKQTK